MRFSIKAVFLVVLFSLRTWAAEAPAQKTPADTFVNPAVVDKLVQMGDHLRSLTKFQVDANISRDVVLENGQKIKTLGTSKMIVNGKNNLYAKLATDNQTREFFFNGKKATIYAPSLKYFATVDAPEGILGTLHELEKYYEVQIPMEDLFNFGNNQADIDALEVAAFVGPSKVNGKVCDHLAFRSPKTDWQIWVSTDKKPLPCKLVITTTDDSSQPEYEATYTWNLNPKIGTTAFTFKPQKGDTAIPIKKKTE